MPRIALTIGDPLGIGPEITAKALPQLSRFAGIDFAVIGSLNALMTVANQIGITLPQDAHISYIDVVDEKPGAVAFQSIDVALHLIADGKAGALVTGPISKKHLHEAGHIFPGHTEILEARARVLFDVPTATAEMLFTFKKFRLLLLTRHLALKDVAAALAQPGAVARPIKTLIKFLRHDVGIDEPRIALLGVNPHAGEIAGEEETKYLLPVLHAVNGVGASKLEGCFAADAFFRGFDAETTEYDAVVAAYHDQGLIPFKLLAGYEAVNITIGLPFIRTSVSHGTAEDIVGKNIAREDSLLAALQTAIDMLTAQTTHAPRA